MGSRRGAVAAIRQADGASFDAIYQRYRAPLYSFLLRLTRQPETAEDLLQETWIRFARELKSLAPDTDRRAWLFTVARNLFVSHHRWRRVDAVLLGWLSLGASNAPPTPEALAGVSETQGNLEHALATLPLALREVILLVAVAGFEPQQAAGILGLRPEALRQRLSRARAQLAAAVALKGETE